MDCPYCGGEMAEGYVTAGMRNRDKTYWPADRGGPRLDCPPVERERPLGGGGIWRR